MSSTFAEHRNFRFHSGIDIPTQQKTGYKVFACQSGYVYRLFTSWWGYGKAVYLKLDDGRLAVYGHLSDFSKEISKVVAGKQVEARRYDADFFPQANEIRVDKGELIGYSGESGRGGPHLHFELRDSTGRPINPLTSGLPVKDYLPPTMKYLAVRPLEVAAKVNNSTEPVIFPLDFDARKNLYRLAETPVIEGKIGLELSACDRMRKKGFNLGIHAAEVYLDDTLLFSSRYDEFSFENTHKIELDRDFELRKKSAKMFYKLFVDEGNDLPLYRPAGGRIDSRTGRPGPHTVKIRILDARGNSSTLSFSMVFDQSPGIVSYSFEKEKGEQKIRVQYEDPDDGVEEIVVEKSPLDRTDWSEIKREKVSGLLGERVVLLTKELDEPALLRIKAKDSYGVCSRNKYISTNSEQLEKPNDQDSLEMKVRYDFRDSFFIFVLEFNQVLKEVPRFSLGSGGFVFDPLYWEQLDEKSYRCVFPFTFTQARKMTLFVEAVTLFCDELKLTESLPVAIITRQWGGRARSPDGRAEVEFEPEAVYQNLNVVVRAKATGFGSEQKLVGKIYFFEPSTIPLNGHATISLRYPPGGACDPHKLGLYELTEKRDWRFVDKGLDTLNRAVTGRTRYLSVFALLEDTLPPKISQISIAQGKKAQAGITRITAMLKDDLSGVGGDQDVQLEIDGEWMIPEYDPEKRILSTHSVSPLSPGKHLLTIWVRDRAGNETEITKEFSVGRK